MHASTRKLVSLSSGLTLNTDDPSQVQKLLGVYIGAGEHGHEKQSLHAAYRAKVRRLRAQTVKLFSMCGIAGRQIGVSSGNDGGPSSISQYALQTLTWKMREWDHIVRTTPRQFFGHIFEEHDEVNKSFLKMAGEFRAGLPNSLVVNILLRPQAAGGGNAKTSMQIAGQAFISNVRHDFAGVLEILNLPVGLTLTEHKRPLCLAQWLKRVAGRVRAAVQAGEQELEMMQSNPSLPQLPNAVAISHKIVPQLDEKFLYVSVGAGPLTQASWMMLCSV